eukprot:3106481-Pyramimonas_sp.AAC.1
MDQQDLTKPSWTHLITLERIRFSHQEEGDPGRGGLQGTRPRMQVAAVRTTGSVSELAYHQIFPDALCPFRALSAASRVATRFPQRGRHSLFSCSASAFR